MDKDLQKELKKLTKAINVAVSKIMKKVGIKNYADKIKIEIRNSFIEVSIPDYYIYVDSGRKAGSKMPPVLSIMRWIGNKGINPSGGISRRQLAFIIARSIANKGIAPRPFIVALRAAIEDLTLKTFSNFIDTKLKQL